VPGVVAVWPVTASWINAERVTEYDDPGVGSIQSVSLLLMMVVVDEMIIVVALLPVMVVADDVILLFVVPVWPANPSETSMQIRPGSHALGGFGPQTSGYWTAGWMAEEPLLESADEARELDPCETNAAVIATTPTVMAQRTREALHATRAVLFRPTSNLIATHVGSSEYTAMAYIVIQV
jgi:hypothetical protein